MTSFGDEMRRISHREFEERYLGGDLRMAISEKEFAEILSKNPALKAKVERQMFSRPKTAIREFIPQTRDEKELLETEIQSAYFTWVLHPNNVLLMPELNCIYAIPNGSYKTKTERYKMQCEGLRSGVPDIHIAVSRKPYFSFYIECKRYKEFRKANHNCSDNQLLWHSRLKEQGHKVEVLWSVTGMIKETKLYLGY